MVKRVVGVYNTEEELIEAVDRYQAEGNTLNNLSVFGNTSGSMSHLGNLTGLREETLHEDGVDRDKGFFASLASAFEGPDETGETSYYDRLVRLGLRENEAREYAGDLETGRIILFEDTDQSGQFADGQTRFTDWDKNVTGNSLNTLDSDRLDDEDERTLKLREEQLDVQKDRVQTGEVRVHKDVVEERESVNVPVSREEVYVERRQVDGLEADAGEIGDDETIRVPIVEEKVEVTKRPVVTEELVIGKKEVQSTERVVENVKREEAHIESEGETDFDENRNRFDKDRNERF
ncbi:YsnF/AvaK domain-containing protein [Bacillus sp. FJAT-27445]|uniref:YsnF/AvaK domain-containing protein n=1 Tax=Bacillus sp. FJAT-27445 TaxID=1679166 RepID=UPI0007432ECF|nr:YsnF/AvaK domain-containing protein [Bacillus sp. FJAT-27445]